MNTITPDGNYETEHKLEEGTWAWIMIPGGLTIRISDKGDHVEVSSQITGREYEAIHTVYFVKEGYPIRVP